MKTKIVLLSFLLFSFNENINCLNCSSQNSFSILVITEANGWVHDSIDAGMTLIKNIGERNNFNVYHSDDSSVITDNNLMDIRTIVFLNTTMEILTDDEQNIMENFIKGGKGFVGVHAAADTEYDWPWYGKLVGGYFVSHPEGQPRASIHTLNKNSFFTNHLDDKWEIEDEWYNYQFINPNITPILNLDERSYEGGINGKNHPITWYHEFEGGKSFYTGLGHQKETYEDARFQKLLENGILYAINRIK